MNKKVISILGAVATLGGAGLTLLSSWVSEKKTEEKIEELVNKAISQKIG